MPTADLRRMDRGAVLSSCQQYRYTLHRRWDAARPPLVVIGLNPSTADATRDDPTIRRCIAYAHRWGFGGVEVGNLFAYRATRPADLKRAADPVGPLNDVWLRRLVAREGALVLCAWGAHGTYRARGTALLDMLRECGRRAYALGVTAAGQPKHPLYLRADLTPAPFGWADGPHDA